MCKEPIKIKSIKDIPPEERGCNVPGSISQQVDKWKEDHPEEWAQGYRPHFDINGKMSIRHFREFGIITLL